MHALPRRLLVWMLAGALAAAAVFALPWRWLERWEADTVDLRLRLRGVPAGPAPVVLVGVDDSCFTLAERAPGEVAKDATLAAMSRPWPWNRRVFADAVRRIGRAGARAIVIDIVFDGERPGDEELAGAMAESRVPVVLARVLTVAESAEGERSVSAREPPDRLLAGQARVSTGYANFWPDDDGVVRRARLHIAEGELLGGAPTAREPTEPSLAAASVAALGMTPECDEGIIDLRGPAGTFTMVPLENLFLRDRWDGDLMGQGRLFRDRVVVIGPWSEVRFKDYQATSFGRMAGAELQANVIASLLERGLLRPASYAGTVWAVLLAVSLAVAVNVLAGTVRLQLAGLASGVVLWCVGAQAAMPATGLLVPVAAPMVAFIAAGMTGVAVRSAGEQRERRRLRRLLSSYVSEQVAELIVRRPENLEAALHGERRPVTVLFSDLRGFTSMTEARPPEEVVAQLNEYLGAMVDCVLASGGTVQKFIGDAILAVWGDTHTLGEPEDAARGVGAALAMEAALARLNASWEGRSDRVPLRMGIGLHQGVVTVGHLGHPRRMEFGVLGDAVNTASRLEGATKHLGISLLVGGPVAGLAAGRWRFLRIGRVAVVGRTEAIELFSPIGPAHECAPEWLPAHENASRQMEAGAFAAAAAGFEGIHSDDPRVTAVIQFLAGHAAALAAKSPVDWDGIIRLDEK